MLCGPMTGHLVRPLSTADLARPICAHFQHEPVQQHLAEIMCDEIS